ncbi:MAG: hypothetical protein ACI9GW_002031 [Halieaceae bacterium]|jgi:hypothetical protein
MSERKARREIDKAIRHLMEYTGPNGEWAHRLETLLDLFLIPVADSLELHPDEVSEYFLGGDFSHMAFGFLFEEYATAHWDSDEESLIDAYLKHRGWREGPAGRRYLQALGESELQFWELTSVKPGAYVELRVYGTTGKSIRVKEKAASESLHQWDGLAARVLPDGKGHAFSGAMLPFRPEAARHVHEALMGLPDQAHQLPQVVFRLWAVDTYVNAHKAAPELRNMDDEPIEPTQLRFPLKVEPTVVAAALNTSAVLEKEPDADQWTWFPKAYVDITPEEQVSIQGQIVLTDSALTLDTNSVARSRRGEKLLLSLLGDRVGTPLTVHQNLGRMAEAVEPDEWSSEVPVEIQEMLEAQLTKHYRQTLDEAIPMLNNKTPRECAADPALRGEVIGWLKSLENMGGHTSQVSYDFRWMWDELNLERD